MNHFMIKVTGFVLVVGTLCGASTQVVAQTVAQTCNEYIGLYERTGGLINFSFPSNTGAVPGTEQISCVRLVEIGDATHTITLQESAFEVRINNGPWASYDTPVSFSDGDDIYLRVMAPDETGAFIRTAVRVDGVYQANWSVFTENTGRSPVTWNVGPGRTHTQLSDIQDQLVAGDVVELDGDAIYDPVEFTQSGIADLPIVIRGVTVNGKRPVISGSITETSFGAKDWGWTMAFTNSHYYELENLEITGGWNICVRHSAHQITIKDSYVHHCGGHGIMSTDHGSGSLTLSNVEVAWAGNGSQRRHAIYAVTDPHQFPDAILRIEHSFIHDYQGNGIKSRANRSEILFNWIEQSEWVNPEESRDHSYYSMELIGPEDGIKADEPIESIVIGNVIEHKINVDYFGIRMGGDGTGYSLGRVWFANNIVINPPSAALMRSPIMRLQHRFNSLYLGNNLFIQADEVAANWGPITIIREEVDLWYSDGENLVYGENNWSPADTRLARPEDLTSEIWEQWGEDNKSAVSDVTGVYFDSESGVITLPAENSVLTDTNGITSTLDPRYIPSGLVKYENQPYRTSLIRPTKGASIARLITPDDDIVDNVQASLNFSGSKFEEAASNDGSTNTAISADLTGDTFAPGLFYASTHFTVSGLPEGLSMVVTKNTGSNISVSLSGNAVNHANSNDLSNIALSFLDAAFSSASTTSVVGATKTDISIDFIEAADNEEPDNTTIPPTATGGELIYGGDTFVEASANDGSIATILNLTLTGDDTFIISNGVMVASSHYVINSIPEGLSPIITVISPTTATMALTGNAVEHSNINDISRLTLNFLDNAFTGANASLVANSSNTGITIDFNDPSPDAYYEPTNKNSNKGNGKRLFNSGVISDFVNEGIIIGGTLDGEIDNTNGTLINVILAETATVTGGVIKGALGGSGKVQDVLLDLDMISGNIIVGYETRVTTSMLLDVIGLDLIGAISNANGLVDSTFPLLFKNKQFQVNVLDLIKESVDIFFGNDLSEINLLSESGIIIVRNDSLDNVIVPVIPESVVTTDLPDGIQLNVNGQMQIIRSGLAITLGAASIDVSTFISLIENLGGETELLDNGLVRVTLDGATYYMRFGLITDSSATANNYDPSIAPLTVGSGATLELVGDPSQPSTFHIVTHYPDDSTQVLIPYPHDIESFEWLMEVTAQDYRIDPETGIIDLLENDGSIDLKLIPDYLSTVSGPGAEGAELLSAGDLNDDGMNDFYFITVEWTQVFYGVPY